MSFIKSYGIALPHFRIEDNILHPKGRKGVTKAICFSDEDIITLAYEASQEIPKEDIDGIFFATSNPVFHNRYHASYLADLLNLKQGITALDFTTGARSGTDALLLASELIDGGKYKNILVIASDVLFPEIGKELITPFGHGACALLLSAENGTSEITFAKSFSSALAEEFVYKSSSVQYDPRFSRDAGFKNNVTTSLKNLVANPKSLDAVILNSLYARMAGGIFAKEGFEESQFAKDTLTSKIGNTGCVHALLLLINELENGKKNILLADYTNGTNYFVVETKGTIKSKCLQEELAKFDLIASYQDYLLLNKAGNFNADNYTTKEMFSSEMLMEREKASLLYLKGFKCAECGTVYFLKATRCKKCKCEKVITVQLNKTGNVYTLTSEHYFPASFPPITMLVIDLDGGGRVTVQQTDTMFPEKNTIEIGTKVKLVLRKMMENDGKPNYFWKAVTLRNTN